jgi:ABC-type uncharacterized transport system permease subunit
MFADFTDRTWLWAAAGFYLAGFVLGTIALLRGGRPSGVVNYTLILVGYALQFVGLGVRGHAIHGTPLGNTFELFQFTAWSAITLYLVIGVTFRNSMLGFFTSCLAAALTVVSLLIPAWDPAERSHLFSTNPWIELHAALAVFSYGVFGLLALTSVMFLARNYSLKSKHLGGWFSFLPSIIDLDHIGVRLLGAGVVILTTAIGVILVYWVRDPASANVGKILTTVTVWLAYGVALGLRLRGRLISKRFAWACLALFALALISLGPVDASRHPATKTAASTQP